MASTFTLVALLALVAPVNAAVAVSRGLRSQRAFLAADMQPEVVAHTLMNVEEEWKAEAAIFVECSGGGENDAIVNCNDAPKSFARSCTTVVDAVVRGSSGDKDVVKEYMDDVCGQKSFSGWQKDGCVNLAAAVSKTMTADNYENRNNFDASQPCVAFWSRFLETEKARAEKEEAERKEAEKKAAEEAAKQAAEAAKKAKEEAELEAKAEAERQKAEAERKKKEEAEHKKKEAEEAAARVKEAAERLAQKKAEAEAVAKAAQEKMEEAAKVEKEHRELLAKANLTQANMTAPNAANVSATPVAAPALEEAPAEPAKEEKPTSVPVSGNSSTLVTAKAAAEHVNATSK